MAVQNCFSKGYIGILKFIEETIELQKKQNWIKANKLILNSSLVFDPQMREIAVLQNHTQVKLKVVYNRCK